MPHVKMLKSKMGSNNGYDAQMYQEGEVYEVTDTLAAAFVAEKVAEVTEEKAAAPAKNKAVAVAPKNKAA